MHEPYNKIDPNQEVAHLGVATSMQKDKDNEDCGGKPH